MHGGPRALVDVESNRAGLFEEINAEGGERTSSQRLGAACGPASEMSDRAVSRNDW